MYFNETVGHNTFLTIFCNQRHNWTIKFDKRLIMYVINIKISQEERKKSSIKYNYYNYALIQKQVHHPPPPPPKHPNKQKALKGILPQGI